MRRYPYRLAAILTVLVCVLAGSVNSFILWQEAQHANVKLNGVNDSLAGALRISRAAQLASESRLQLQEDATLGLLLALESAETTRAADGKVLPESASSLMNAMQRVGGTDATASRGIPDTDPEYRVSTVSAAYLRPSPDGRWLVTIDYTRSGIVAALFDAGLPLREEPRRRWMLQPRDVNVAFFDACWTADSRHFLSVDHTEGEVVDWDVLAGLSGLDEVKATVTVTESPPSRNLGKLPTPEGKPYSVEFLRDARGEPNAVFYMEELDMEQLGKKIKRIFLHRRSLELAAPQPLGPQVVAYDFDAEYRRQVVRSAPGQPWLLMTDPYLRVVPILAQVRAGETRLETRELPESKGETDAGVFSADGRWLTFPRRDGLVRLYDLQAGDIDAVARSGRDLFRRPTPSNCVSFSPDGQWLAASGEDSLVQVASLKNPTAPVIHLRITGRACGVNLFSSDSQWLAVGGENSIVSVWKMAEIDRAARPIEFCGLSVGVLRLNFSQDGKVLTAVGLAGECRRWEFNGNSAGVMPLTSTANGHPIRTVAASPDGRWIASAGYTSAYREPGGKQSPIRLVRVGETLTEYPLPGHYYPTGVAFSQDGRWLASTGRDAVVRVWEFAALTAAIEAGKPLPESLILQGSGRTDYNRFLAFHPKGRLYCTCGDGILFEWDLTAADPAATVLQHKLHSIAYLLTDVAVSPDGHWLAVGRHGNDGEPKPGETQFGNMVLLYDVSDPAKLVPREEFWGNFRDQGRLAISSDSRWLAAGSYNSSPQVWDLQAGKVGASARQAPYTASYIPAVAFSPMQSTDGPWLAFGDANGRVHLWDWQHDVTSLRRVELADPVQSAAFLPDGRLITGSRDARMRVWETDTTRLIELAQKTAGRVLTQKERARFKRQDTQMR